MGSGQDEVFGAIASYAGTAAVGSYTRHYQPTGVRLDYAYWPLTAVPSRAVAAGALHRITTQSSDPRVQFVGLSPEGKLLQGVFIGDYAAAAWARTRCCTRLDGLPRQPGRDQAQPGRLHGQHRPGLMH